jgi:hypothetical protein
MAVVTAGLLFLTGAALAEDQKAPASKEIQTEIKGFNDEAFLDAAYDNCATVENRSAKSCNCERKLIGDRVSLDDKKMAYLYWTDKERFVKEFEVRKQADPNFAKAFSERFSGLQATIIAACGA